MPILSRWPGLKRVVLHTSLAWKDPFPVNPGKSVLLAELQFESVEALNQALGSPQRTQARRDFENFPPFEGTVTHQAMNSDEAWRRPA